MERARRSIRIVNSVVQVDEALNGVQPGLARDVADKATSRIAPEQRALRSLEHLDPVDIEQGERLALADRDVAVVEIHGVRRLDNVVDVILGHAADRVLAVLASERAAEMHARRERREFAGIGHVERAQLVAGIGGDGDTHLLDVLLATLRGDDDVTRQCRAAFVGLVLGHLILRGSSARRVLRQRGTGESANGYGTK